MKFKYIFNTNPNRYNRDINLTFSTEYMQNHVFENYENLENYFWEYLYSSDLFMENIINGIEKLKKKSLNIEHQLIINNIECYDNVHNMTHTVIFKLNLFVTFKTEKDFNLLKILNNDLFDKLERCE